MTWVTCHKKKQTNKVLSTFLYQEVDAENISSCYILKSVFTINWSLFNGGSGDSKAVMTSQVQQKLQFPEHYLLWSESIKILFIFEQLALFKGKNSTFQSVFFF